MNVLITAAGGGGTNGIVETYKSDDVNFIGVNSNFYVLASSCTTFSYKIPMAKKEKDYIKTLNELIEKHNIEFIIPNSDIEVEILAKNRDNVNAALFLPTIDEMMISNDKLKTYEHCIENGINVPKTISFDSFEELKIKFDEVKTKTKWCRIKEGAGSQHTSPISSFEEAKEFIENTIRNYNLKISDFTISDFLPGDDCLVSSIWKDGKLKFIAMAHRMEYLGKPGQSAPIVIKKMFREELKEFLIRTTLTLNIKPHGIYNVDVKYDLEGNIALTEFNLGRFYYNMPLFNTSKDNYFNYYMDCVVKQKERETIYSKDELYFLRGKDNFPVVLTESELKEKVRIIDGN